MLNKARVNQYFRSIELGLLGQESEVNVVPSLFIVKVCNATDAAGPMLFDQIGDKPQLDALNT